MIGMDQQAYDCGFVDSGFAVLCVPADFIPEPTACSQFGWLSDDLVTMLDRQDYSSTAPAACADVYQLSSQLAAGPAALSGSVSLGDFFAGNLVAGSSDISVALDVYTGKVSPASLGVPGHEPALVDSVVDDADVQSVKFQEWLYNLDPVIFEPETVALLARSTNDVLYAQQKRVNNVFKALKAGSVLNVLDSFYLSLRWQDQQAGCLDWIRTVSASLHGSASWSAEFGFVGGGNSTAYINSHYNPATGATNFSLNSFSVGSFVTAAGTGDLDVLFGASGSTGPMLSLFESTYNAYEARACATTHTYTANNQVDTGLIVLQRTASNAVEIYKNGTGIATHNKNAASVSIPSLNLYICGNNLNGTGNAGSTGKIGAWWAGADIDLYGQQVLIDAISEYLE